MSVAVLRGRWKSVRKICCCKIHVSVKNAYLKKIPCESETKQGNIPVSYNGTSKRITKFERLFGEITREPNVSKNIIKKNYEISDLTVVTKSPEKKNFY